MEKPPKKKKPKKVKMTAEMIEKLRIEAELEAARQAELEKRRLEEERKAAIEKEKREIIEHRLRQEQLDKTMSKLMDMVKKCKEANRQETELAEWEFYITCGRLPNPSLCDQMNTYLHLWEKELDETTMEEASKRTEDVVKLLTDLQDLLDTATDVEDRIVNNWKWVRQLFRDHQKENLEVATYKLLRNIEKNLHRIDIPTADFNFADENLNLSIWLRVQLPVHLPNPRRPPKSRIEIAFPNVNMEVLFPSSIDCDSMAVRSVYLKYDHLSDLCASFYIPNTPSMISSALLDSVNREWRVKLKYKYDNRDRKTVVPKTDDNGNGAPCEEIEKTEFSSDEEIPLVPYKKLEPTASEMAIQLEDTLYSETKQHLTITVPDHVINLRRFSVLGGVFCLNLVYQPPQPQQFVTMDLEMTKLFLPKKLEHVDFSVIYTPPAPPPPGLRRLPEQIEEEMRLQEEEMDKLMLITLTWPSHVIFLELPIVCYWDEGQRQWSKKNIHDLKHNEEKGILTFRTGLFGTYGLATIRYVNLPYQAWELKAEEDGSVTFQITAAILMLEFNVNKEGLVCLSQLQNSPNKALTEIIGVYFKLFKLKRKMKEAGIDVFPEPDAFCYIEGACEKHWPMEKHLYYNMAQMAPCFNFAWSRWNLTAGRRNIVMQMREYVPTKTKQKNHSMLLVTPQKASLVECTEVSQVFCDDDVEGLKFSADLYNLIKAAYSITIRKKAQNAPWEMVHALYELLLAVKVLSFS
ncbi:protein CASC1-like [Anoplophora glabripennis]|uniref:protein CASC1-like n=1 Tax=Anoplophora glabripennis TaxID=217634 RepID=UPI000C7907DF|nr:protein CASC1-like [Anoplophora glabripennis]